MTRGTKINKTTKTKPKLMGTLYVIAAPSGGGKTSLVNALVKTLPDIRISVSHTTRPKRPGEEHGVHYWFVPSAPEFEEMIAEGIFLEHAQVFNYYYGTSGHWVEENLREGIDIILEIDWQGAQQIRKKFPHSVSIFILPPSLDLLRERLLSRNQDHPEVIERRLTAASSEMSHYHEFDYLVINDVFDLALADLQTIVRANRLMTNRQAFKHRELLENLLKK